MKDVDQALSQISSIRQQMAISTRFLGLSPEFNLVMGAVALVIALVQTFQLPTQNDLAFVSIWAAVLVASSVISTLDVISRARRKHGRMANSILTQLLQRVAPFLVAMVMVSWIICQYASASVWLLPGLWQVLLSLLGFAALSSLPKGMLWICVWYFMTGMVVLSIAAQTESLAPWMMGVPFTVGQVVVGLILAFDKNSDCKSADIKFPN